ncbi:hypothetical protein SAMN04487830_10330 [Pseudobutyrivibrio sp. OR37]|uniref:hypothetical protein n=1 Tax=Pseudobutyrivibrio sp. OR37 TaxID=1798186 RepID=UPI0008EE82CB|nr:hypothetical protein [Pseudobutyrivibrio sp. OR37]SFH61156.1 hypothetical protein SAMN04487830_10330 [Pseudobutyrivibrio sp. OR37]
MRQTDRFSTKRVGYAVLISLIFIAANTLMCSIASVLVDKYICMIAINICFFCLFLLLIIRRRLENKLPEYNYISYGKIAFVVALDWALTILFSVFAPDFFAPFIVLPIIASAVFDDSLSNAFGLYLVIITALCFDYSVYMIICYITMVLFGNMLAHLLRNSENLQRLYSLIILFAVTTLLSVIFYYFNYLELQLSVLVYGLFAGVAACLVTVVLLPILGLFVEKAQIIPYEGFIDPDYSLVNEIRMFSTIEYQHAKRISALSKKCAKAINANEGLAACAAFYYRLGKIEGEPMIDNAIKIANNHCFPNDVIKIMSEYGGIVSLPSTKESAIVHMVDSVVTKVELFDSDSMSSSWNQNMVIYQTINELSQKGFYDNSGLTMNQFLIIRDILANEDILA